MAAKITIIDFLNKVNNQILNPIIIVIFSLSFVYFAYGVVKFLSTDVADKARIEARNAIIWGLVGILIMFSVRGILSFVLATFRVDPNPGTTYILDNK